MQKVIGMVTMQINERRLLFNFVKCSQLLKCRSKVAAVSEEEKNEMKQSRWLEKGGE